MTRFETFVKRKLSHAKRRRIKQLDPFIGKLTSADLAFFERFPHRMHRLRHAAPAEVERFYLINGKPVPAIPPNCQFFSLMRLESRSLARIVTWGPRLDETDFSEKCAALLFGLEMKLVMEGER
jgi:hypothetical protein